MLFAAQSIFRKQIVSCLALCWVEEYQTRKADCFVSYKMSVNTQRSGLSEERVNTMAISVHALDNLPLSRKQTVGASKPQ